MTDWPWPAGGHRLHATEGLLGFTGPDPGPDETAGTATTHEVWLATDQPHRLAYLTKVEPVEWDACPDWEGSGALGR